MKTIASLAAAIALFAALDAGAQVERSGSADTRVMQQLQQVTNERNALKAEQTKAAERVKALEQEVKKLTSANAALGARTKALEATAGRGQSANQEAEEQLTRTRGQMNELVTRFRETAQQLKDVEGERATMRGQLATRERDVKACFDRNAGLYNLNTEILDRMENRGFLSGLAEREPFTRIARTKLENLADEYRDRAAELRTEQTKADAGRTP
jgi:chromosome segregation ATPase